MLAFVGMESDVAGGAWVAATGTVQIRRCGEQERTEIDSDSGPRARCRRLFARAALC